MELKRKAYLENVTIGELFVDGLVLSTLEPGTSSQKGAIPRGVYLCEFKYSPKFSRFMWRLKDVPGFDGILIHTGNTQYDTKGCILLGTNADLDKQCVNNSRRAYRDFVEIMHKYECGGTVIEIS